jgi:hypothetical protein
MVVANDGVVSVARVAVCAGNESVLVPATDGADKVIAPLVSPDTTKEAIVLLLSICIF